MGIVLFHRGISVFLTEMMPLMFASQSIMRHLQGVCKHYQIAEEYDIRYLDLTLQLYQQKPLALLRQPPQLLRHTPQWTSTDSIPVIRRQLRDILIELLTTTHQS